MMLIAETNKGSEKLMCRIKEKVTTSQQGQTEASKRSQLKTGWR
jgi:hypothetical protein